MGEGKTRVILPMLALECANGKQLVRLNFLPTLLDEAYAHLHRYLTASVLCRKLFLMPFNRDVKLDVARAAAMRAGLMYCQQVSSTLLSVVSRLCCIYCAHQQPRVSTTISKTPHSYVICCDAGGWAAANGPPTPAVLASEVA
jgi:hypothetical protein